MFEILSDVSHMLGLGPFLLAALVLVPVERLVPQRPQAVFRPGWDLDLVYVLVNKALIVAGLAGVTALAAWIVQVAVPSSFRAAVAAQPVALQFVEALVAAEIGFYSVHRCFHAVPALWRLHVIHHGIEHMDWLAAARVHPVDQICTKGSSLFPLFILGFSDSALALFAFVYYWHSLFLHANVRITFGRLDRLIATPRFHHWHHALDRAAVDRNFAGQLAIFDWVFGTLYVPDRPPERFGVPEVVPYGYLRQLVAPFRRVSSGEGGADLPARVDG